MSTEFRFQGEWVATRWAGRRDGQAWDFGSVRRFDALFMMACDDSDNSLVLDGEDGSRMTLRELFLDPAVRPTFGEFVGNVELGSGELLDRLGLDELPDDPE